MKYFAASDWVVIVSYLTGIIAVGLWVGKGQKTTRDYFLGSRNIPWWGVGLSIIASETSGLTIIGIPALAFGSDLAFLQIAIGYVIARIVLAVVMVPHYMRGEIYSPYQLLTNAFGPSAGRLAGGFFLLSGTLAAGVRVYVTSIPLKLMLDTPMLAAILLFVGLALVYTCIGGIKAVIWTDVVQFSLFMAGGVFTLIYTPHLLEGGFTGTLSKALAAGKLHWLNTHFSLALPFNIWMGLFGATAQVMASHGADQLIVQRVLTCKSAREARKALILSAVIILPLFAVFLLTGTMLWAYYQQFPLPIPLPSNQAGMPQDDYIFPIFIMTAVPPILKGFLMVAILSAAMSAVSSAMAALASVSTMDFFKGLARHPHSDEFYFRWSRYSTVFWALLLVLVAYASREVPLVLNWAFSLNGLTSGAMLGGVLLALWLKPRSPRPVFVGMISSLALMVVIRVVAPGRIDWPWYTLIGTVTTVGLALLVRAVQTPQPAKP
jgi:SSS family solute:Na+ symporter